MKFKVGDVVNVIDEGCLYTTNHNFFEREEDNLEWNWRILRYAYGDTHIDKNVSYKILYIESDKALITYAHKDGTADNYSPIYLININGLIEKETKVMTHKEIKELLGYDIIIKEGESNLF